MQGKLTLEASKSRQLPLNGLENKRIAIVLSEYDPEINNGLFVGALTVIRDAKIDFQERRDLYFAPGAFEIPLIAKKISKTGIYSGLICLGSVIKGETAHFEYISDAVSKALISLSLESEIPMAFGILTTYNRAQALACSSAGHDNKGREAATACLKAFLSLEKISNSLIKDEAKDNQVDLL